jgi:prepilin-type N-terminal cleavage/methylation domain-containing protein
MSISTFMSMSMSDVLDGRSRNGRELFCLPSPRDMLSAMRLTSAGERSTGGAFSLVELMATVVIIGILAALALISYSRYKTSEVKSEIIAMLAAIATSESEYRAQTGVYLGRDETIASNEGIGSPPLTGAPYTRSSWNPAGDGNDYFNQLGVNPPRLQLYGSYSVMCGKAGQQPASGTASAQILAGTNASRDAGNNYLAPHYVAIACADVRAPAAANPNCSMADPNVTRMFSNNFAQLLVTEQEGQ